MTGKSMRAQSKAIKQDFYTDFAQYHFLWLRQLVAAYKERGEYPVLPTQIIEYYRDQADKEFAIFSTLCMSWDNGKELEQIADMRRLIGGHPAEWVKNREFVVLSIGREQDNKLDGYKRAQYWKIAKVYDVLYDLCYEGQGFFLPSDVFTKASFADYCQQVADTCEIKDIAYKQAIIELVLRTSDGIGRGLWPMTKKLQCPQPKGIKTYLKTWFPDWHSSIWTFEEAISLFRLEHDYDFYYAFLAHTELARLHPLSCKKYLSRFQSRWKLHILFKPRDWKYGRDAQPEIKF